MEAVNQFLHQLKEDQKLRQELAETLRVENDWNIATHVAEKYGYKFTSKELWETIQERQQKGETWENEPQPAIRAENASVQLDNFLTAEENHKLLEYAIQHQSSFVSSLTVDIDDTFHLSPNHRRSLMLETRADICELIIHRIHQVISDVRNQLLLPSFAISGIDSSLTAHNDGHFYKLHKDNNSIRLATREITFVYYFSREPKPFTGGELRIYYSQVKKNLFAFKQIEPRNNSIVFFPSRYLHEILPINCPSQNFADSRFTINGWIERQVGSSRGANFRDLMLTLMVMISRSQKVQMLSSFGT
ncbi:MAG TPA: proline hydroxylase [Cyanobacteria bacterium UBA11162]|nr:proline hydroxylase [Cyanobacteria bacterium UBA11162]